MFNWEQKLFTLSPKMRWVMIIAAFIVIALLDFGTPSAYIWAYLYIIPILISVSFLKPHIAKALVFLAVFATLLNLVIPQNVLNVPPVFIDRLLSALAIMVSAFFMVRYIRHQKQLQEQDSLLALQQNLAEVREDFIATLTHDLKTPLLGEEQALKQLLKGAVGALSAEQTELLEILQRGNQRQLELVQTLVTTYKNDNLGVDLQLAFVDMDALIADILIDFQHIALERGIELSYFCNQVIPQVHIDSLQIKRVVANLLHNALNYTPQGGCIRIDLRNQPGRLLVEVTDSGPGITPEDLKNVFKRFYQSGEKRQVIGTGLGLYLSQQIVLAHRGTIWAENIQPKGCKFSFTLPTSSVKTLSNDAY